MASSQHPPIEYRCYHFDEQFPIIVLTGDIWRISDVRSNRLHFHNCLEIGICESGGGFLQLGKHTLHYQEGDIVLIGTDVVHTTWSDPGTASKWSYIYTDFSMMLSPYFPLSLIVKSQTIIQLVRNFELIIHAKEHPGTASLIHDIINEMQEKAKGYQFSVRGLVLSLLVHLSNIYESWLANGDAAHHSVSAGTADVPVVNQAISIMPALSYIRDHYNEDFNIEELASRCCMSPTSFRRTFSATMGTSPLSFLQQTRIRNAARMLRLTNDSILTIANAVGYKSLSSFNRQFHDIMGVSPRDWRTTTNTPNRTQMGQYDGWLVPEDLGSRRTSH